MAALLLPAPLRLNAPFPPVNRVARDASAANHPRFPPHARTVHADAPRKTQNVAQNVASSTKVSALSIFSRGAAAVNSQGRKPLGQDGERA